MDLVYKKDDLPGGVLYLFYERFQAVLKLAAELCTGDERPKVKHQHLFPLQWLRDVTRRDALGQTLHNGRLSYARLANKAGIVLGPARKHLHQAPQFLLAADHGVQLAGLRAVAHIDRVFLKDLELALRRLVRHARGPAQLCEDPERAFAPHAELFKQSFCASGNIKQREQKMFARNEFVLLLGRHLCRLVQRLHEFLRKIELAYRGIRKDGRDAVQFGLYLLVQFLQINARALKHGDDQRLFIF